MNDVQHDVQQTFYDAVGGAETFHKLTARFYEEVAKDEVVRPLYPEADLGPAERRMRMFLEQYWGGPHTYSDTRGHPRLRIRHAPFAVTPDMRDRWVGHMNAALDSLELPEPELSEFRDYVTRAAAFMVNSFD